MGGMVQKEEWHVQRLESRKIRTHLRNTRLIMAGAQSSGGMGQERRLGRCSGPDLIYSGF